MVKNLSDSFICLDVITDNLIIDGSGLVDSSGECSYVPNEIFLNETVCIDHDYICNIWIFPPLGGAFLLDSLHVDLPSDCNCNLSPGLCDQTGLRDSCLGNVNLSSKDLYIRNRNNITIKNTDCLRNIILEDSSFSYSLDSLLLSGDFLSNLIIINSLVKFQKEHNSIEFQGRVNSLGSPESFRNAISINSTDFYVDTLSKPELNKPAVITLFNSSFTEGIALKFNNQIPPEGTFNILSYNPFKVWIKGFEICERIIDPCYDCYYYGEYRYHSCSCETFYGWESRPSYNDILPCPSGTTCIDNLCQQ
jgi:hypothetical protein